MVYILLGKGFEEIEAVTPGDLLRRAGVETAYVGLAPQNIRALGFGAGMGLPNIKKYSDDFDIHSEVGKGTTLSITVYAGKESS